MSCQVNAGGKQFPEGLHLLRLTLRNPSLPRWAPERILAAGTLAGGEPRASGCPGPPLPALGMALASCPREGPGHGEGVQQHHAALGKGGKGGAGAARGSAPSSPSARELFHPGFGSCPR